MKHTGSCHCGRIAFEVDGDIGEVMECNCSHCRRKGYLLWFVPETAVRLETPESDIATYTFNKRVIQHHFCPTCGCAPLGFGSDGQGNRMAAVNVRCLPEVELSELKVNQVDGKSF